MSYYIIGYFFDICLRISDHPPNCIPFLSLILCSPFEMTKQRAIVMIVLNTIIVNTIMWFTKDYAIIGWWTLFQCLSYILNIWIGMILPYTLRMSAVRQRLACVCVSLLSTFQFYIITNFGVWVTGGMYDLTFDGLMQCYTMAIPFLKWQILADIGFLLLFFSHYTSPSKDSPLLI